MRVAELVIAGFFVVVACLLAFAMLAPRRSVPTPCTWQTTHNPDGTTILVCVHLV